MLTTRGPKLLHGGEPRSVANVDATPNATATAHPRASRGRAIASKFRRLRALQNQIQPMALKAQHTISKLRKKLIRGRELPELRASVFSLSLTLQECSGMSPLAR